ncbi:hypothetical protein [Sulfolobus spindle-shaped virus 6]|uniref:Uncharacterized protein n=1 Tax=Sulfolobus spindle-shaped virus 6 TaxID=693627 RepID=D1GF44_9VIRU|nr:hypothetical protein SSSV6_gp26 [Sulfolobus spindle-shaped virus 6]ACZ35745.1 hypothetical protein [Sulfolobus spindle-shaped virus 6]
MSLIQKPWFRIPAYLGIFFFSWGVEALYLQVMNNELAYNLGIFILGALVPFLVSLVSTFKFMRKGYLVGPIVLNVVNFVLGLFLYALILLGIAVGTGMG